MLYHIDDDPDSTAPNPAGGTGDLTAVGVASAANAAAAAVIASATSGLSAKGSFKATATKTNASPTDPDPDRVQPGVSIARVNIQRVYHKMMSNKCEKVFVLNIIFVANATRCWEQSWIGLRQ